MRTLLVLLAVLLTALLAPHPIAAQADRSYVYEEIAVDLTLLPGGDLSVVETYTYRFTGGPFQRALRGIAAVRLDEIRNIGLAEGAQPYSPAGSGEQPGTYVVERSPDEVLVRWFYEPAADARRTFTLSYTVAGTVRSDPEADELWWVAVFPERDVPVERARVTLRLPAGADLRPEDVILPDPASTLSVTPELVTLRRDTPLAPGESLEMRVTFAPDLISAPAPAWQRAAAAPAPTPAPARPAASSSSSADLGFCFIVLLFVALVGGSMLWRAINGEPVFASSDNDDGGSGRRLRRSSSSSSWGSSRGSSSSSSARSSSSRGSSGRGGSGGGRGGAG